MNLNTTPIPTRNWKITKDPVSERDLKRKSGSRELIEEYIISGFIF